MNESFNKKTTSPENGTFDGIKEEIEFDAEKNFINAWGDSIKNKLTETNEAPIDVNKLMAVKIEDGLSNSEWEKQFITPYIYGIRASAAEIGDLARELIEDKDGLGVDKSIKGIVGLFSDIYGLKNTIDIEPIQGDERAMNSVLGFYIPGTNTLQINFQKMSEKNEQIASQMFATIAHEMWHAHQDEISNGNPTLRQVVYHENINNYTNPEDNYHGYQSQLIEDEARSMGYATQEVIDKIYNNNKDAFNNNMEECVALKTYALQALRTKEQKFNELNI